MRRKVIGGDRQTNMGRIVSRYPRSNVSLTGEGLKANLIRAHQTGSEPIGAFALKVDSLGNFPLALSRSCA